MLKLNTKCSKFTLELHLINFMKHVVHMSFNYYRYHTEDILKMCYGRHLSRYLIAFSVITLIMSHDGTLTIKIMLSESSYSNNNNEAKAKFRI